MSASTVAHYRPNRRQPRSQSWWAFLENHAADLVAADFYTVSPATLGVLCVLLVMSHERFNVASSPTSAWTALQLVETFPFDIAPRLLARDNNSMFRGEFSARVESLGTFEVRIVIRLPWRQLVQ